MRVNYYRRVSEDLRRAVVCSNPNPRSHDHQASGSSFCRGGKGDQCQAEDLGQGPAPEVCGGWVLDPPAVRQVRHHGPARRLAKHRSPSRTSRYSPTTGGLSVQRSWSRETIAHVWTTLWTQDDHTSQMKITHNGTVRTRWTAGAERSSMSSEGSDSAAGSCWLGGKWWRVRRVCAAELVLSLRRGLRVLEGLAGLGQGVG
jgi:hypothetical protein